MSGDKKQYRVGLIRTAHRFLSINVEATSLEEARQKALDEAGGHDFPSEQSSDYAVDSCEEATS